MEDFQEQIIEQFVREREASLFVNSGYSVEQITSAIITMVRACEVAVETVAEQWGKISGFVNDCMSTLEDDWELEGKREIYKLDFSRPIISHQVLDRKPKQLIKKVIH